MNYDFTAFGFGFRQWYHEEHDVRMYDVYTLHNGRLVGSIQDIGFFDDDDELDEDRLLEVLQDDGIY